MIIDTFRLRIIFCNQMRYVMLNSTIELLLDFINSMSINRLVVWRKRREKPSVVSIQDSQPGLHRYFCIGGWLNI